MDYGTICACGGWCSIVIKTMWTPPINEIYGCGSWMAFMDVIPWVSLVDGNHRCHPYIDSRM